MVSQAGIVRPRPTQIFLRQRIELSAQIFKGNNFITHLFFFSPILLVPYTYPRWGLSFSFLHIIVPGYGANYSWMVLDTSSLVPPLGKWGLYGLRIVLRNLYTGNLLD